MAAIFSSVRSAQSMPGVGRRPRPGRPDTDPEEAAWQTAVGAAPWLVGEPGTTVPPDQLYEKLKPFEECVAHDIEQSHDQNGLAR